MFDSMKIGRSTLQFSMECGCCQSSWDDRLRAHRTRCATIEGLLQGHFENLTP